MTEVAGLPAAAWRLGAELVDQQLWFWGLDIAHEDGNVLIRYGFHRIRPPSPDLGSSAYVLAPAPGRRVILWGWGIFWGSAGEGGIFLRRHAFAPRLHNGDDLALPLWRVEQLPPMRLPRGAHEQARAWRLLGELSRWIAGYEAWVRREYGEGWRVDGLHRRPRRVRRQLTVSPERYVDAWHALGLHCECAACADAREAARSP